MKRIEKKKREQIITLCYGLPLLLLPLANIGCAMILKQPIVLTLFSRETAWMLLWVCAEELVFRKGLPAVAAKTFQLNAKTIGIISSIAFALAHCVNLFQGAALSVTAVQILFAFGAGYALYALAMKCKTIIPGIIIHFILNITGNFTQSALSAGMMILWIALAAACFIYGEFLFIKHRT